MTPLLRIEFCGRISPAELPAFRGALAQQAGPLRDHFHNHRNPEGGYHHRYPRIQYKRIYGKPALICLGEGAEEVQALFEQGLQPVRISGREMPLHLHAVRMQHPRIQVWEQAFTYRIHNWIALTGAYAPRWDETPGLADRITLLERCLLNQIVGFAKAAQALPQAEIRVAITDMQGPRWVKFKGISFRAFDAQFRTNLYLPDYIGLGKCAALGYGTLRRQTQQQEEAEYAS